MEGLRAEQYRRLGRARAWPQWCGEGGLGAIADLGDRHLMVYKMETNIVEVGKQEC